uniref:Uncharacterized protein n=1 Tax=Physcomitrium patens TaxID=3218 RepID=A0A2K1K754_PHYPA|nr:hypothetical protein PHYPA_011504 [Physcomitrium patens]
MEPRTSYISIKIHVPKLLAMPISFRGTQLYHIPEEYRTQQYEVLKEVAGGLLFLKSEDYQYFGALLGEKEEVE